MPVAEEVVVGFARPLDVIVHPVHSVPIVDQDQHDLRQAFWVFSATQGLAVRPLRGSAAAGRGGARTNEDGRKAAARPRAPSDRGLGLRPRTSPIPADGAGQDPLLLWAACGGQRDVETIASEPLGCFRHIFLATFGSHIPGSLCVSRLARGESAAGTSVGVRPRPLSAKARERNEPAALTSDDFHFGGNCCIHNLQNHLRAVVPRARSLRPRAARHAVRAPTEAGPCCR